MVDASQLWSVSSNQEYQDQLAPFDVAEDYSTASLMKNKGPNLSMEKLSALSVDQIVREILIKASIIDYERLIRLLKSACDLSKKPMPREQDLISSLISNLCLVTSVNGLLVCKSTLKYDMKTEKRQAAMRDYVIHCLENNGGQVQLSKLFKDLSAGYSELKDIIEELGDVRDGVCFTKRYKSMFKSKLSMVQQRAVNEKWVSLAEDIQRYKENSFYPVDLSALHSLSESNKAVLVKRLVEEEVTKLFSKVTVTTT